MDPGPLENVAEVLLSESLYSLLILNIWYLNTEKLIILLNHSEFK